MQNQSTNNQVTALQILRESNRNGNANRTFPQGVVSEPTTNLLTLWDLKDKENTKLTSHDHVERTLEKQLNVTQYLDSATKKKHVRKRAYPKTPKIHNTLASKRRKTSRTIVPDTPPRVIPGGNLSAELEADAREMKRQQLEKDNQELEPLLRVKTPSRVAHIHPHPEPPANQQEYMDEQELYQDYDPSDVVQYNIRKLQKEQQEQLMGEVAQHDTGMRSIPREWLQRGGLMVPIMDDELHNALWYASQLSYEDMDNPYYEKLRQVLRKERRRSTFISFTDLARIFPVPPS